LTSTVPRADSGVAYDTRRSYMRHLVKEMKHKNSPCTRVRNPLILANPKYPSMDIVVWEAE